MPYICTAWQDLASTVNSSSLALYNTFSIDSFLLFRLRTCNASCWVLETIGGMSVQLNPDLSQRSVMRDFS